MIPKGQDRPYCVDDYKYYVRDEAETTLAVRDELVALVREALEGQQVEHGTRKMSAQGAQWIASESNKAGSNRSDQPQQSPWTQWRVATAQPIPPRVAPNGSATKPVVLINRPVEQPDERSG